MRPTLPARVPGGDLALTRRRFLQLVGISVAGIPLGCFGSEDAAWDGAGAEDAPPFSVWRQIREALRASPDHLPARAARLVETRDPEALFAFVRDEIVTFPARGDGFGNRSGDAVAAMRWGVRGTLRCGAGTPREKAELLVSLLRDAGFEAEVVAGRLDPNVDPRDILLRPVTRLFAPEVSPEQLQAWARVMGVRGAGPLPVLDGGAVESGPLADAILASLPADTAAPSFDFSLSRVPLVRVMSKEGERYANPLVPGASFGDPRADRLAPAARPRDLRPFEVAVQVASTDDPSRRITVAEGQWPLEETIGRRIVLQFVPVGDLHAALRVPATRIRAFTPVLALDDAHAPREALVERGVVGSAITVGGEVLGVDDDGRLSFEGLPMGADVEGEVHVAAVEVEAAATGFPVIRLRICARNTTGEPVLGLTADNLGISEGGVALPFLLRQSRPPPPRLLLLFDLSNSLPTAFRDDGATALARRLAEEVLTRHADASLQVASVVAGSANGPRAWTRDPDEIETSARRLTGWGSDFWSALASARRFGANVIVLITDGQSTDAPREVAAARAHVASGPPVVGLAVGEVRRAELDEIAALTGGAVFEVADHRQAVDAIIRQLEARSDRALVVEYEAPREGPVERTVQVRAGSGRGIASYRVPAAADRLATPALAGIYLVVRSAGHEVVRTLAGIPPDAASAQTEVDQAVRDDVRAALFGTTILSVEAGAPTLSVWLDDMLSARLTWQPLVEAARRNDLEGVARAMEAGVRVVPSHTLLLHPPLEQSDGALTFETEPRLLLLSERPLYEGGVLRTADLLPLNGWATAASDSRDAFRLTARRTARLAVMEARLYDDSTTTRLVGRPLHHLPPIGSINRESAAAGWAKVLSAYAGRHRLLPTDGGPFAFWAIDRSGTLVGILPDGSGGGISKDVNQQCKAINQNAALNQLLNRLLGLPFVYGAIVLLAKAIAKQYLRAAAIVASLGDQTPDTSGCGKASDFLCDLLKDALTQAPPGAPVGIFDDLVELGTGSDFIECW